MGVLEQVTELKKQGVSDGKIINSLREQGVSPKDINNALSQIKIKNAVSRPTESDKMEPSIMPAPPNPQGNSPNLEGADLSNGDLTPPPAYDQIPSAAQKAFGPMTKEADENGSMNVPHPGQNAPLQTQTYYTPSAQEQSEYEYDNYANQPQEQGYYSPEPSSYEYQSETPSNGADSDTVIEIAEQVFSEKIKPIQKSVDDLTEISTLVQSKIENFSDRLKRIESTIDHLQSAILDKIGSYGSNLDSIKKEMSMMQDSFGKVVNAAVEGEARKNDYSHHEPSTVHKIQKTTTVVHRSSGKKTAKKKK